jgi:hypothetical protein
MERVEHDGQPVRRGALVGVVGGNRAAGAGHVLHHHGRIAGNVLAKLRRKSADEHVGGAARFEADDDAQCLAGKVVARLRDGGRGERENRDGQRQARDRRSRIVPHVSSP